MTQKELIEHLKSEVKRVKIQRNEYEQLWMKANRELQEVIRLYNLPSYLEITRKHLQKLKSKNGNTNARIN